MCRRRPSSGSSLGRSARQSRADRSARTERTGHSALPRMEKLPRSELRSFKELPDTNILHVNIQGLRSHMAELCAVIRVATAAPDIVCVNETFLDDGVEEVQLEGYIVVGRRDRSYSGDVRRCGGIIVFARTEIAEHVTLMSISDSSERMWILMHTLLGPYLLCTWYRPSSPGEVQSISDFETEYNQLKDGVLGLVRLGDLNLHSQRWLRYSSNNSAEGDKMRGYAWSMVCVNLFAHPLGVSICWICASQTLNPLLLRCSVRSRTMQSLWQGSTWPYQKPVRCHVRYGPSGKQTGIVSRKTS